MNTRTGWIPVKPSANAQRVITYLEAGLTTKPAPLGHRWVRPFGKAITRR